MGPFVQDATGYEQFDQDGSWNRGLFTYRVRIQQIKVSFLFLPLHYLSEVAYVNVSRSRYHLKDVIVGKIYFLLVRIKIKHMELSIIRRETTGAVPNQYNESETITKFEIMDGAPVRGTLLLLSLARFADSSLINDRRNDTDPTILGGV